MFELSSKGKLTNVEEQHDNARSHAQKSENNYLVGVNYEFLLDPPYSPNIAPSDFYLFWSTALFFSGEQFSSV